jgi:hypothetical protein
MIASSDLPAPPATPPSAVANLLRMLERHIGRISTTFNTVDFIGHFQMTALEGHQRLNEMAEDGLITSVPGSDLGHWQLTRDGIYVLSPNRKRLTKKFIADVTACLCSIGPELLRQGALELSLGGRPLEGKANGHLLVGIRLKQPPFSAEADNGLLLQLCHALDASAGQLGYEVMLFADKVPFRLKNRTIVIARDTVASPRPTGAAEVIDKDEAEQSVWRKRFCEMHRLKREDIEWKQAQSLPWGLRNSLAIALLSEPLPLRSTVSTWVPDDETVVRFCDKHGPSSIMKYPAHLWRSWSPNLFATLEFKAASGSLSRFCKNLESRNIENDGERFLFPLFELARTEGSLQCATARALNYYRSELKQRRNIKEKAERTKPKLVPSYLLFFDTLNFFVPLLVGFVRQPAGHGAHVDEFIREWDSVVRRLKPTPAAVLSESGYYAGSLSLDVRDATAEEKAFFDDLCKSEGTLFRYILFMPNRQMACRKANRLEFTRVAKTTPPLFQRAKLGRPIHPRLVSPWSEIGTQRPLSEVIQSAAPKLRKALEANIVSLKHTSMSEFARRASLKPCIDLAVLASGLLEAWTFSYFGEDRWEARASADEWEVVLEASKRNLHLTVSYGTESEKYPLAPFERKWGRATSIGPYDDSLGALISLLDVVRALYKAGLHCLWEDLTEKSEKANDRYKQRHLSKTLCHALHGMNSSWGPVVIDWPYFPADVKEEVTQAEGKD